jgi:hypothetical protein
MAEKNVNKILPCEISFLVLGMIKNQSIMKDKLINWFQDVTVWLAWYLIVSTALLAIFIVPSYIAQVLCK